MPNRKRYIAPRTSAKRKSIIHVANEAKLDAKEPIPREYTGTSFYSMHGINYIPFLMSNDDFFNVLQEARVESVTQGSCITTKADYTIGDGVKVNNKDEKELPKSFINFRKKANNKRQTLNEVVKNAILYFYGSGNAPIEIVRGEVAGQRFLHVFAHNVLDCRLQKNEDGDIVSMVYSNLFRKCGIVKTTDGLKQIPLYERGEIGKEISWVKDENTGVERTAIWLKNYYTGYDDYGMPSSLSSLIYQIIEYQGARYNLDNLENNMVLGGALVLAGNLGPAESNKLGRKVISQHTGSGKRGRVAVFSSESGIENSKYFPFDVRKEGSYKDLSEEAESKIILANQWDAVLAGIKDNNSLGKGSGYLKEVYDQKMNTVIKPIQNFFIEHLINPIAEIASDWLGEDWSDLEFYLKPIQIINPANNELNTSATGIQAFLDIVKAVNEGWYSWDAAVQLISKRFGCTEADAEAMLGEKQNVQAK